MTGLQPHELTIKILNSEKDGGGSSVVGTSPPTETGGKAVVTAQKSINSAIVARELRSIAQQVVSYTVSNISLTTGNSISQERIQVAMGAGAKLAAYGTALATGNIGAAAIMAIGDTMNTILRADRIAKMAAVENESLALSRDRAGIAFNQSRMGAAK